MADVVDYQTPYTGITARTSTTLESTDMTFAGVTIDGAGDALKTDYSDIKEALFSAFVTQNEMAADDTTPAAGTGKISVLATAANTVPTAITDIDTPLVGQIIVIIGGSAADSSTIADGGNFTLSASFTAAVDAVLVLLVRADNDYIELTRSTN